MNSIFYRRFFSGLIDRIIIIILFIIACLIIYDPYKAPFLMGYANHQMGQTPDYSSNPIYNGNIYQNLYLNFILIYFIVERIYFLISELLFKRTLGKKIFGLEFISSKETSPTSIQFTIRSLSYFILFGIIYILLYNYVSIINWYYSIITLLILISPLFFKNKNQTLYDLIARLNIKYKKKEKKIISPKLSKIDILENKPSENTRHNIISRANNFSFIAILKNHKKIIIKLIISVFSIYTLFIIINVFTYNNEISKYEYRKQKWINNIKTQNEKDFANKMAQYNNEFIQYSISIKDYNILKTKYDSLISNYNRAYDLDYDKQSSSRKIYVKKFIKYYQNLSNLERGLLGLRLGCDIDNLIARDLYDSLFLYIRKFIYTISEDTWVNNINKRIPELPFFGCANCPEYPIEPIKPYSPIKPILKQINTQSYPSYEIKLNISNEFWSLSIYRNLIYNILPLTIILVSFFIGLILLVVLINIFSLTYKNFKYLNNYILVLSFIISFSLLNYILRIYVLNDNYTFYIYDNLAIYFACLMLCFVFVSNIIVLIHNRKIRDKFSILFPWNKGVKRFIFVFFIIITFFNEIKYLIISNFSISKYDFVNLFQFKIIYSERYFYLADIMAKSGNNLESLYDSKLSSNHLSGIFLFLIFILTYLLAMWIYNGFRNKQ